MDGGRAGIGDAPKRREDQRFITGGGRYLDDMKFAGLAQAVMLRSPYAHARIDRIDTNTARRMPGVVAILTAAEVKADGLSPLVPGVAANTQTGEPFSFTPQRRSRSIMPRSPRSSTPRTRPPSAASTGRPATLPPSTRPLPAPHTKSRSASTTTAS
jgi:hypothetical protein